MYVTRAYVVVSPRPTTGESGTLELCRWVSFVDYFWFCSFVYYFSTLFFNDSDALFAPRLACRFAQGGQRQDKLASKIAAFLNGDVLPGTAWPL